MQMPMIYPGSACIILRGGQLSYLLLAHKRISFYRLLEDISYQSFISGEISSRVKRKPLQNFSQKWQLVERIIDNNIYRICLRGRTVPRRTIRRLPDLRLPAARNPEPSRWNSRDG